MLNHRLNPKIIIGLIVAFLLITGLLQNKISGILPLVIFAIVFSLIAKKARTGQKWPFNNFNIANIINQAKQPRRPINMNIVKPINPQMPARVRKSVITIAIIIVLIIILSLSLIIIPAGTTGVYHIFGKVKATPLPSGLHLKNPFASITKMSVRTEEYTMTIIQGEGRKDSSDTISALTKEGLSVDLDITVLYRLMEDRAPTVFKTVGTNYDEKIIRPEIRAGIREVVARYLARELYSEKREEASNAILAYLEEKIEPRGIEMETVLLRNVSLPAKLSQAIEEKLQADQDAQRMSFVLEKETKEAERKRIEAAGQRDAQTLINQSLTDKFLHYLYVQGIKDRPGTIYVPVSPDSGMPLFKALP